MFPTSIAGSLPKPAWLAETRKLWPQWQAQGDELRQAKADATLLWIKVQEDAGLDIVGDGEQSRQHFVHGFLEHIEGIDFQHKVKMGIRGNRYDAMVPQVVAPLKLKGRVHAFEAQLARAHTKHKLKFTLPGPMTIVDTVADCFYGDKVKMAFAFAELLNQEALALQADGVDIVQFDEPAFNVYMKEAAQWGVKALERAAEGLTCTTAVHICYGYGIQANVDWKKTLGEEWRQYEQIFPALAASSIDQVSLECYHSHVPPDLMKLLGEPGDSLRFMTTQQHHHGDDHDHDHDHTKWKHDGVRVVPGNQLDGNTAQTPGMDRKAAINFARTGAQKLWAGTVTIHANAKTGAHHHGHLESVIYIVKGRARMRWGEHLEFTAEAGPGDFIYVPPYVPHQEINASPTEALECVLCRSDGEAVAVNLDIEPVEKPQQVLWVDPTHPHGGV